MYYSNIQNEWEVLTSLLKKKEKQKKRRLRKKSRLFLDPDDEMLQVNFKEKKII